MTRSPSLPQQYFAAVGRGDVEAAVALLAPGADFRTPIGAVPVPDGVRGMLQGYGDAFPGHRFEVQRTVTSGDDVVVEGVWVGTHTGPMHLPDGTSIPATGRSVAIPYATVFKLDGDRIAMHHAYWDMAGFLGQLGLTGK